MAPDLHQLLLDRLRQQGVNFNEATTLLCGLSKVLESHRGIDTTAINSKLHRLGWNSVNGRLPCLSDGYALYGFVKISSHKKEYHCMSRFSPGPWHVEEENGSYGVLSNDALLAVALSDDVKDKDTAKANAHLMASAPRLLEVIKAIKEHLDNNMIVTGEGLKINDSHLRESIIDAILKAEGHRL